MVKGFVSFRYTIKVMGLRWHIMSGLDKPFKLRRARKNSSFPAHSLIVILYSPEMVKVYSRYLEMLGAGVGDGGDQAESGAAYGTFQYPGSWHPHTSHHP